MQKDWSHLILAKDQSSPAQALLDNCIGTDEAVEILNKSQVQVKWLCRNKKMEKKHSFFLIKAGIKPA